MCRLFDFRFFYLFRRRFLLLARILLGFGSVFWHWHFHFFHVRGYRIPFLTLCFSRLFEMGRSWVLPLLANVFIGLPSIRFRRADFSGSTLLLLLLNI